VLFRVYSRCQTNTHAHVFLFRSKYTHNDIYVLFGPPALCFTCVCSQAGDAERYPILAGQLPLERRLEVLRDHTNGNARSPTDGPAALACSAALERSIRAAPPIPLEVRYAPALNMCAANSNATIPGTFTVSTESSTTAAGTSSAGASATSDAHHNAVVAALGPKLAAQQVLWALRTSTSKKASPHAVSPPGVVSIALAPTPRSQTSSISIGNRDDKQQQLQILAQLKWSLDPTITLAPPSVLLPSLVGANNSAPGGGSTPTRRRNIQEFMSHGSHGSHRNRGGFERRVKQGNRLCVLGNRLTREDARSLARGTLLWFDPVSGGKYNQCVLDTTVFYAQYDAESIFTPYQVQWPDGTMKMVRTMFASPLLQYVSFCRSI